MADETQARELVVVDDHGRHRFEMHVDGVLAAFTQYRLEDPTTYAFTHTSTLPAFAGQGIGTALIGEVMARMRAGGFAVLPFCPFVNAYLRNHPEDADLVPAAERRRFGITA